MSRSTTEPHLPGLRQPAASNDGLDAPFWEGAQAHELRVQQCLDCGLHQWGPEWMCHQCNSMEIEWVTVDPVGQIYSSSSRPRGRTASRRSRSDVIRSIGVTTRAPRYACTAATRRVSRFARCTSARIAAPNACASSTSIRQPTWSPLVSTLCMAQRTARGACLFGA